MKYVGPDLSGAIWAMRRIATCLRALPYHLEHPTTRSMRIEGTVTYQDLEGGFWGIEGSDGVKYRPVDGLPGSVRAEGCRIIADIEPANVLSFAMWGRNVRIIKIKKA